MVGIRCCTLPLRIVVMRTCSTCSLMSVVLIWRRVTEKILRAFTLLRNMTTCLRFGGSSTPAPVEVARRDIAKTRIDFVRDRALQVCIGLQSLRLDALQLCEILQFACGAIAPLIPFHIWWKIATTVKHFHQAK
jgi:hypothetical protein